MEGFGKSVTLESCHFKQGRKQYACISRPLSDGVSARESSSGEGAWALLPHPAGLSLVWTCLSCVAWALSQEASPPTALEGSRLMEGRASPLGVEGAWPHGWVGLAGP